MHKLPTPRRRPLSRWLQLVLLSLLLVGMPLPAAELVAGKPVPRAVEKTVRAVVEAQLEAFANDDAQRAFSLATPEIRRHFGSAERFLLMVRVGYPVVHRPRSVVYLRPEGVRNLVMLPVQMTDDDGRQWLATYTLQQQKDKAWRIAACTVVEDERLST